MSISKTERIVGHNAIVVDATDIGRSALGSLIIPEQRAQSDYPDYSKLSNLERAQKVNWVSDWVKWLRRDKNAIFNQEYAKDVLTYFNQALVSMVNDPDPQTSGNVRSLNRLVLGLYDHVYQLGEGVSEQVLSEINNENLRVLATEVIPDDIIFWGDSLVVFETLLKDKGKLAGVKDAGRPWRLERLLVEGRKNNLPRSLQRFVLEVEAASTLEAEELGERSKRLMTVKEKLAAMNIAVGTEKTQDNDPLGNDNFRIYIGPLTKIYPKAYRLYSEEYVGKTT